MRVAASDAPLGGAAARWSPTARSFGFDVHLISPAEARELFPLLNTDGIHGATWVPSDGYADPSQLTHVVRGRRPRRGRPDRPGLPGDRHRARTGAGWRLS